MGYMAGWPPLQALGRATPTGAVGVSGARSTGLVFDEYDERLGEVTDLSYSITLEPVTIPAPPSSPPMSLTFTTIIELPKVRWWTKVWCWSWHGHWPKRQDVFDFAMDYYRCPCSRVVMSAEELIELSERFRRHLPYG